MKYTWVPKEQTLDIDFNEIYNNGCGYTEDAEEGIRSWLEYSEWNSCSAALVTIPEQVKAQMVKDYQDYLDRRNSIIDFGNKLGKRVMNTLDKEVETEYKRKYSDIMSYEDFKEEIFKDVKDWL